MPQQLGPTAGIGRCCHDPAEEFLQEGWIRSLGAPPGNAGSSSDAAFLLLLPFVCFSFSFWSKLFLFQPQFYQFPSPSGRTGTAWTRCMCSEGVPGYKWHRGFLAFLVP